MGRMSNSKVPSTIKQAAWRWAAWAVANRLDWAHAPVDQEVRDYINNVVLKELQRLGRVVPNQRRDKQ